MRPSGQSEAAVNSLYIHATKSYEVNHQPSHVSWTTYIINCAINYMSNAGIQGISKYRYYNDYDLLVH